MVPVTKPVQAGGQEQVIQLSRSISSKLTQIWLILRPSAWLVKSLKRDALLGSSYMSSHEASNAGNFMSTLDRKQPYSREGKKGVDRKGSRSAARELEVGLWKVSAFLYRKFEPGQWRRASYFSLRKSMASKLASTSALVHEVPSWTSFEESYDEVKSGAPPPLDMKVNQLLEEFKEAKGMMSKQHLRYGLKKAHVESQG
eukprot:1147595-Pelagomonas_calceolata.AAC.16